MTRLATLEKLRDRILSEIEAEEQSLQRIRKLVAAASNVATPNPPDYHDQVATIAAAYCNTTTDAATSRSRRAEDTNARHITFWILNTNGTPLAAIGRMFDRDHTTVMHGVNRVNNTPDLLMLAAMVEHELDNTTTTNAQEN